MERLESVVIPLKVKDIVTTKRAIIAEIVMASAIIGMAYFQNIHSVLFANGETFEDYNFIKRVLDMFHTLTPFTVISVSSIIIGVKIRASIGRNESLINSVTRNLLAVNVAYIITQFPYIIYMIMVKSFMFARFKEPNWIAENGVLIHFCILILKLSTHAINCLAYVLSGKTFRNDLRNVICRRRNVR
ncbi:hypothetical protein DPMN_132870 [Dreissena polymorpha]|uniref:Uncharacterized protein n=1 Tax=Dreissena polymorpha TaxID=45954 RepID=A0A9D4FWS3_DREPO|nr:hypothetical protein DPMN_132870 [Dreissena polymorpha]